MSIRKSTNAFNRNTNDPQKMGEMLLRAVLSNHTMAHELIDKGAHLDATNSIGMTPLMLCVLNSHDKLVDKLVAAGANLFKREKISGQTALDLARMIDECHHDERSHSARATIEAATEKAAKNMTSITAEQHIKAPRLNVRAATTAQTITCNAPRLNIGKRKS